jgi:predicted DNA-binding protein (MmcQ/YjbR family)
VNPSTLARDRLARLREICLSFPETAERVSFGDPNWTVKGKGFAAQKGNFEGGRPSLWFRPADGEQQVLASDRERFFVPPYVGGKGWLAMYLDAAMDWSEIAELVEDSYRQKAPKRALKVLDATKTNRSVACD